MNNEESPPPVTSLLLDIGPGAGALLVKVPEALVGTELEILDEDSATRTHAIVRPWPGDARFVALYPELSPGDYSVLGSDDARLARVRVMEGGVATADIVPTWR